AGYIKTNAPWPKALDIAAISPEVLRDRYRGALLWGAAGDALGRPAEGLAPAELRARYGPDGVTRFIPPLEWRSGPKGTITDDTQLTMEVARSLIATDGHFSPDDLVTRLIAWLPHGRGKGPATTRAVELLEMGTPWWEAGRAGAAGGNGAAMRAAPVGLVHALDPLPLELRRDAVLAAGITHAGPPTAAGAGGLAAGAARRA